jgi:hypothetical protein
MADINKAHRVQEKIRQALEKLGKTLDEWLRQRNRLLGPVPVPVDRPYRPKPRR